MLTMKPSGYYVQKAITEVAEQPKSNFRARIVYKSGVIQDLLIVAESTNAFQNMRDAFKSYLTSGTPKNGVYLVNGTITIVWSDVASFYDWID